MRAGGQIALEGAGLQGSQFCAGLGQQMEWSELKEDSNVMGNLYPVVMAPLVLLVSINFTLPGQKCRVQKSGKFLVVDLLTANS